MPPSPKQPPIGKTRPDVHQTDECELLPCKSKATFKQPVGYANADGSVDIVNVWVCDGHKGAFNHDHLPDRAKSPHVPKLPDQPIVNAPGGDMPPARKMTAESEGYQVIDDDNLLDGVEGRVRQLEAQKAAFTDFLAEAKAVGDEDEVKDHQEKLDALNKRLTVAHARRNTLLQNIAKADREAEKAEKTEQ